VRMGGASARDQCRSGHETKETLHQQGKQKNCEVPGRPDTSQSLAVRIRCITSCAKFRPVPA
jgi:hypothetical protein